MDLRIVSHDEGLQALCREVLVSFLDGIGMSLNMRQLVLSRSQGSHIWDFQADTALPDNADQTLSNQLF